MKEYKILNAQGGTPEIVLRRLSADVTAALQEGWELAGSMTTCHTVNGFVAAQPVTTNRFPEGA